jgi:Na+-transporting NADH:ubiquinone oxidoreductase subunit NqrF
VRVTIVGMASGKRQHLQVPTSDLKENLLKWLRTQNITIASSCDGEGVCKKCVIQNDWLTCQLTLEEFLQHQPDGLIYVAYL